LRLINAILETLPAIFDCLSAIGPPIAVVLEKSSTSSQQSIHCLCSRHKYLQKEILDLAEAFIRTQDVYDKMRDKRTDVLTKELYERTKALCHTNSIPEPDAQKRHFVLETTLGSGCLVRLNYNFLV